MVSSEGCYFNRWLDRPVAAAMRLPRLRGGERGVGRSRSRGRGRGLCAAVPADGGRALPTRPRRPDRARVAVLQAPLGLQRLRPDPARHQPRPLHLHARVGVVPRVGAE